MTDIGPHLERLGLEQYLDAFLGEGFDTWATLLDIQESDFDALNVKLGHRRKLQRAIAEYRGIPYERVVGTASHEAVSDGVKPFEVVQGGTSGGGGAGSAPPEAKRKYRRHPKADENAPERPPSAYVIFSNKVREEVKGDNLSFTEIAKLVGDRWQKLDPSGKEPYESQANSLKEQYNIQLSAYKKTEAYAEYMQYLAEFKAKYGGSSEPKRPKLEPESSGGSTSAKSLEMIPPEHLMPGQGHVRGGSIGSVGSSSYTAALPSPIGFHATSIQSQITPGMMPFPIRLPTGSSRGESPPSSQPSRDARRMGQLSTQSSVSDESSAVRSESDTVMRAAALSLSTPPSATPPLPPLLPSAAMSEHSSTSDILPRLRYPPIPQHLPLTGVVGHSSSQTISAAPLTQTPYSAPGLEGNWRTRDSRTYAEPPRRLPQTPSFASNVPLASTSLPPLITPDRPPEIPHHSIGRTLPPLHGSPPQQQTASRLGSSVSDLARQPDESSQRTQPSSGGTAFQLDNSENDAASALAGLASVGRFQSRNMSDPRQPRP